jgi:mannose-6-phosphate isomerase-like protein (cupin superfamily)
MNKTYFLDIDGVLVKHNGNLSAQIKTQPNLNNLLPETINLINQIENDGGKIILTTGRKESMRKITEYQLEEFGIFYDQLVMGCNRGARVLVNDLKPNSNLKTAYAFTPQRNKLDELEVEKILKPCEERPWGNFATLAYNDKYHIKEIKVKPGCSSSLQSHLHRDELWLVIEGQGEYVLDDKIIKIEKNSICVIKKGQKHRIINNSLNDLKFIEIQTGEKFSEEDITRYEDQFGRI